MAESPPFNQVTYTSASAEEVGRHFSSVRAYGWRGPFVTGPNSVAWSRDYMTTTVLVVGLILLLTTLIGGLVLLARSHESLAVTVVDEGRRRKVIVSGAADTALSSAIFAALSILPAETPLAGASAAATGNSHSDPSEDKLCPLCAETVRAAAKICRFCGHNFEADGAGAPSAQA